ncbi:ImmA/IrrE family metallo-endopeptidase [Cytobacillus oceanisediminis]|uniref:ImmA/IrrE family metallo-endopeptidase n=1 Tax=Cytobacillus oceanisediminis TaxID=665099 RepID=UPI001FB39520|nr:ImmA/IrrE family metallo-endopeptidase [Cytobacillus oceanisediminis]UOE54947.1 hypothetical protein IRB79_24755 [Cytobacillus oceanisediminis]
MFKYYTKTELELIIESIYRENDILTPSDLTIKKLERTFKVNVCFLDNAPNRAIWEEEFAVIFLKPKMPNKEIRSLLFHEIGHPFRHIGSQEEQTELFRALQEAQADVFQLYAAIPIFMLEQLDIPPTEGDFINLIEETFQINRELAIKRMEQIKARIWCNKLDIQLKEKEKQRYRKASNELSGETLRLLAQLENQVYKKKKVKVNL